VFSRFALAGTNTNSSAEERLFAAKKHQTKPENLDSDSIASSSGSITFVIIMTLARNKSTRCGNKREIGTRRQLFGRQYNRRRRTMERGVRIKIPPADNNKSAPLAGRGAGHRSHKSVPQAGDSEAVAYDTQKQTRNRTVDDLPVMTNRCAASNAP
jgi:hypothetical protein